MAEQKATSEFLLKKDAIKKHLTHFKAELEERLWKIYDGFIALKKKGYAVDAITPQAAIYLTLKIDLAGKKFQGKTLDTQAEVTSYLLSEAKLAVVPFYAFGADHKSPWYRLSIGTCRKEEINEMLGKLEHALSQLEA